MNDKQTAVEWLVNAIHVYIHESKDQYLLELLEQAKEMEKQHIIDAVDETISEMTYFKSSMTYENGEQYYKEKYKPQ